MTFIEPKAPMMHSAEPWTTDAFDVVDCSTGAPDYSAMIIAGDGESIIAQQMSDRDADRAAACVNALANIPDPAAFVEAARGMMEALESAPIIASTEDPEAFAGRQNKWLRNVYGPALATFRTATGEA